MLQDRVAWVAQGMYSSAMAQNKKPKRDFSQLLFPARPKELIERARKLAKTQIEVVRRVGLPLGSNVAYISWLKKESMLAAANKQARAYSGKARLWQNPYARPRPKSAIKKASVWFTAYPVSMITKPRQSTLCALGEDDLWRAFAHIGIKAAHTGPMKLAGGITGWKFTPSVDGHFDRISNRIDAMFGSEQEFVDMSATARRCGGIIIDDLVPGHTGKGADFRLAEMNYQDYPGVYHMVEIDRTDWTLLPDVPRGKSSVNLSATAEEKLKKCGYIVGKLQRVFFYEPGVKETNWSATRAVRGVDGVMRRWVYLHYWKDGQPSINWLDPSFAGMKLVVGDAVHSLADLHTTGLRLDANALLGIERTDDDTPAWSEGHPLSSLANQLIAGMVRKFGGFTFQEFDLSFDDISASLKHGADLTYDFIARPAYHHALATGDTEFLKLSLELAHRHGIEASSMVHALQNHDELNFGLTHFSTVHKDEMYHFRGHDISGAQLADTIRSELKSVVSGASASYNLDHVAGVACTTASLVAAVLGVSDLDDINDETIQSIKKLHLLLAAYNALQPGVFALSGWDLVGALTLDRSEVSDLIAGGDTRWVNRGAYDLMGRVPNAERSELGMPRARCLYGSLPEQLADERSFASQLKSVLDMRERYNLALSRQVDIATTSHKGLFAMVHMLPDERLQLSVLNFCSRDVTGTITSQTLTVDAQVIDMNSEQVVSQIDKHHSFTISLKARSFVSVLIVS